MNILHYGKKSRQERTADGGRRMWTLHRRATRCICLPFGRNGIIEVKQASKQRTRASMLLQGVPCVSCCTEKVKLAAVQWSWTKKCPEMSPGIVSHLHHNSKTTNCELQKEKRRGKNPGSPPRGGGCAEVPCLSASCFWKPLRKMMRSGGRPKQSSSKVRDAFLRCFLRSSVKRTPCQLVHAVFALVALDGDTHECFTSRVDTRDLARRPNSRPSAGDFRVPRRGVGTRDSVHFFARGQRTGHR